MQMKSQKGQRFERLYRGVSGICGSNCEPRKRADRLKLFPMWVDCSQSRPAEELLLDDLTVDLVV